LLSDRLSLSDSARQATRRRLRRCRELIGDSPPLLPIVLLCTPEGRERWITSATDVVIEGFPRCGNTFAAAALQFSQRRPIVIASRFHVPAQVKRAVRLGVPTLVVIREPISTVSSLVVAAPHVRVESALNEYIHHYQQIIPFGYGFVVGDFDEVTTDFGIVVDRLNKAFRTNLARFEHTEENVAAVFELMDERNAASHKKSVLMRYDTRPSAARTIPKQRIKDRLRCADLAEKVAQATEVYRCMVERPGLLAC
jgi:hypothetical protein